MRSPRLSASTNSSSCRMQAGRVTRKLRRTSRRSSKRRTRARRRRSTVTRRVRPTPTTSSSSSTPSLTSSLPTICEAAVSTSHQLIASTFTTGLERRCRTLVRIRPPSVDGRCKISWADCVGCVQRRRARCRKINDYKHLSTQRRKDTRCSEHQSGALCRRTPGVRVPPLPRVAWSLVRKMFKNGCKMVKSERLFQPHD